MERSLSANGSSPPTRRSDFSILRFYTGLDRFTVTFDAPNDVNLDEITVTTTGGTELPLVLQTRRGDGFAIDTVEVLLDRPLPADQETRSTFDDGTTTNEVVYNLGPQ